MDRAADITALFMIHTFMWPAILGERVICAVFIRSDQANFIGNHFLYEPLGAAPSDFIENAGDHIAFALDCADLRNFAGPAAATSAMTALSMLVVSLAANPSLIDFDDAAKLMFWFNQSGADFVAHGTSGLIGAEAHCLLHLQGADALFASDHHVNDTKPVPQRLIGVLKDSPGYVGRWASARGHYDPLRGAR